MNEDPGMPVIITGDDPDTLLETNLTGVVTGRSGNPLSDVAVSVVGEEAITDENGVFRLENIFLSNKGSVVRIEKEGYFDGFQFVSGQPGKIVI